MVAPTKPTLSEAKSVSFAPDQIKPNTSAPITLQDVVANLELLYVKAKNYHWNVKSTSFYGLHHTFDGVQEIALEWADTIAERSRALDVKVDSRMSSFLKQAWFSEARSNMSDTDMIEDMVFTLKTISEQLMRSIRAHVFDPVTENKLQDLCAEIDKQNYFVKSNLV